MLLTPFILGILGHILLPLFFHILRKYSHLFHFNYLKISSSHHIPHQLDETCSVKISITCFNILASHSLPSPPLSLLSLYINLWLPYTAYSLLLMLLCIKTFPPPFNFLQLSYPLISLFIKTLNTPPCLYRIFFNKSAHQLGYPSPPCVLYMCCYQSLSLNSLYTPLCSYKLALHLILLALSSPSLTDMPFNYFIHINIFCLLTLFLKFFKSNYFIHIYIIGGQKLLCDSVGITDIRH